MTTVGVTTSTAKDFVASNKIVVRTLEERGNGAFVTGGDFEHRIYRENFQALREFFRNEEDERLGRWRYPGDPSLVVYVTPNSDEYGRRYATIDERTGERRSWNERACMNLVSPEPLDKAARAYFDAHPKPKPWHDAKPGEVWELTVKEWGTRTDLFYVGNRKSGPGGVDYLTFEAIAPNYPVSYLGLKATVITAGERKL